jgi:7-carboxy-7-deazaguanine synthase
VLKICEIFASIQGESSYAGLPCVFVRLTGCNMRCLYCDTKYAYEEGAEMSVAEVLEAVQRYGIPLVEITGGEPLLQDETPALVTVLLNEGHTVLIETNGSLPIDRLDRRAVVIMDVKTPGSGMSHMTDLSNLNLLKLTDELKCVITGREDYEWAKALIAQHQLAGACTILFSPDFGMVTPRALAEWILEDRLPVRLNVQLHKYLFGPDERGV